ncbi:MAG: 4-hydroxythreonine-4-phosphate dehydrogenase PdxA [Flexistipes sinusarabici]|uniref:4-hydroxythreonine-4-phosphate dehydrogenase PdxA n=1 Tax=Flexistipes sinusarabici TaxID=2352 RepID=A0A5D0MP79_FLESI|nr:4-hydroxythreonine-4-phosphate dehydrogenase PdxA [Flexistipes sinusarabici]TYB33098.1 MAG: 4-hydroxythreonine-4-phosphate dehydrogenase PdxA [Flexistipes sinusarabici]
MNKSRIVITLGDPAGIGPEITAKLLSHTWITDNYRIIISGNKHCLLKWIKNIPPHVDILEENKFSDFEFPTGRTDKSAGEASIHYINKAVDLIQNGEADALCTCPINKKSIQMAGYDYKGHTDFLAELTNTPDYSMMLMCEYMKVVLATTHIPLREVSESIKSDKLLKTIKNTHNAGRLFGTPEPKIAVSGLNPHSGDEGVIGFEEQEIIAPAIEEAENLSINVEGPFAADSLFTEKNLYKYDFFIAMYHDQGLIPLKMKCFSEAVNVTLNLPIIRTSVDHGTAYDIAGKNIASENSLIRAVKTADKMVKNAKANENIQG